MNILGHVEKPIDSDIKIELNRKFFKVFDISFDEFLKTSEADLYQKALIIKVNPDMKLPLFDGNVENALKWLRDYEDISKINGFDEREKMKRVSIHLTQSAKGWYLLNFQRESKPTYWKDFVYLFKSEFINEAKVILKNELFDIRQLPAELPADYFYRVVSVCLVLENDMAEDTILKFVMRGMLTKYKEMLALNGIKKLEEVSKCLRNIQKSIR